VLRMKFVLMMIVASLFLLAGAKSDATAQNKGVRPKVQNKKAPGKKPAAKGTKNKETAAADSEATLASATEKLKADLAAEIALGEANLKRTIENERVEEKKLLYEAGIISKTEIEQAENRIAKEQAELEERKQLIKEADNVIAEAKAMEKLLKMPPLRVGGFVSTAALIRYNGTSAWTLTNISKVQGFFVSQFGRSLPVSAFGQTATHDRLNFDHRNSVDVAIHPDSAEGQAVIAFLRNAGIPFLAFRQAVPGSATGAHIHIGYPSRRIY
jgi:hypothetical protein